MSTLTAVELGADSWSFARTSVRSGDVHVSAVETLDPAAFPGGDMLAVALRQLRRKLKLPRRCRVVMWGLPDGASRTDPAVTPRLQPLVAAGFKIERVVTPCNALGALGRLRISRSGGAMCWLGINRAGVAIVVVRPGKLLYSHSFGWDSSMGAVGTHARLLQRYTLVASLAPEVRRAVAAAREQGTTVDGIVTCGNLPDLRSLTMPLIEELDLEVETLDSLDGIIPAPPIADRLADMAPAIRIAAAAALARGTRTIDEARRRRARVTTRAAAILRAAAVVAGLAAIGYVWYARSPHRAPSPRPPAADTSRRTAPPVTPAPQDTAVAPQAPPQATPSAAVPPASSRGNPTGTQAVPPSRPARTPGPSQRSSAPNPPDSAARPRARPVPAPASPTRPADLNSLRAPTDKPGAAPAVRAPAEPMPALLTDPVPRITALLVAGDRRFATVGEGKIIRVGDVLGRRVVVAIDEHEVVLREPSGVQIRVGLGGRVIGVQRGR